jgi:periplasmic protein CpxP/Spy
MNMTPKLKTLFAAVAILGGLAATTVFAQETTPSTQPPQARGMMSDHGGMMGMMGQMSADHMKQMTRMVDNCNRMMEGMSHAPMGPDKELAPGHDG